ncbi:MAG: TIGR03936 family radical SAM-associated protein [Ruminococcus sp.]|nr:TIGR03936 family radical SAM-associated protein [Ruminococcus sp.]
MIKLRAVFEKSGRAKYISHLDLNRCMLRVFRRSKLPVWYTEGFNPHPYFSFALALSLGFDSKCEILDFSLNEELPFDEVRGRLNDVLPEGMRILSVSEPKMKITEIAKAEYSIVLSSENAEELLDKISLLIDSSEILVEKKTKKGVKTIDLKPFIEILNIEKDNDKVLLQMRLPAGTQTNYNPTLFLEALKNTENAAFEAENICRTGILCENNDIFL